MHAGLTTGLQRPFYRWVQGVALVAVEPPGGERGRPHVIDYDDLQEGLVRREVNARELCGS